MLCLNEQFLIEMESVGDGINSKNSRWSFGGKTHENFDNHISKSVPLYNQGHSLILKLSDFFLPPSSLIIDIGCSTGSLLSKLAKHQCDDSIKYIGCDVEEGMVNKAKENCSGFTNVEIYHQSAFELDLSNSNMVLSYYTMQFIHPSVRQDLFNKIYKSLKWGGAFIYFEKVRAPDARFQDIISQVYSDYKLENGYTPDQILAKSKSLKGILEPFSSQANIDLSLRAGFNDVMSIFKYACFEGFLAIK